MNPLIQLKTITPPLLIALTLLCPAAAGPRAQAVVPPPDGGYPGFNTAEGQNALFSLTTGAGNAAVGWFSLFSNTEGSFNSATGAGSLLFNTGNQNTAFGAAALLFNTTGQLNTAVGTVALQSNTTACCNTAVGVNALSSNTTGTLNTAVGLAALRDNTIGDSNTATGSEALTRNTTGDNNTATGFGALFSNTTGTVNTAVGRDALGSSDTGTFNTALGAFAGSNVTTANGVLAIGHPGANVSDTTWIGGVYGVTTQSGMTQPVIVSDGGQLGTISSSRRFKKDIEPMDKTSERILALKPVTFHYESDSKGIAQFGLIAEDVAKVSPDLVIPGSDGKPYSVRYDQVNAMLLNEFLKEHRKNEEQEVTIARQQKQIEALAAGLQKVNAQLIKVAKHASH